MKNPDEKRKTVEDAVDFRLIWNVNDYWADVVAYEHCGEDFEEAEQYLCGFVKWDGCSQFELGSKHLCGPYEYAQHARLLRYIFFRAHELMGREPEDKWPEDKWPEDVR